jgi:predicted pyridoxine 5'-phosphate oxidase superfamily flavin-nucleotide-binding protein
VGILTAEMQRFVRAQRLGYVATVCPDGTPNLSPKGTTTVWDEDHLVFADICSPSTVENLSRNPSVEINVVDPISRKGYRFKGRATVLSGGERWDELLAFYRRLGTSSPINSVVLVRVESALPVISPAYGPGVTEAAVRERWRRYDREALAGPAPGTIDRGEPAAPGER